MSDLLVMHACFAFDLMLCLMVAALLPLIVLVSALRIAPLSMPSLSITIGKGLTDVNMWDILLLI